MNSVLDFSQKILRLLPRNSPSLLGVDISPSAIKLIELTRKDDRTCVESYAIEPFPSNVVVENKIEDIEALAEAIKRAVKRSGTRVKKAATAVSGSEVITKIISVPAGLSERELESQIELEAAHYIPYPLEEVNLDFEVLSTTEKDPEVVEVLLAACRSENVDVRVAVLELAGLTPAVIDVDAYAIENVFPLLTKQIPNWEEGQTVAVVNIGTTLTAVSVLHKCKIIYTREQVLGGNHFTEEIQRRYSLSYEEARLAKHQGGPLDSHTTEVLESFKGVITRQVSRTFQFFFSSAQHNSVDHVILAGGCASIPGIDKLIENTVGASVSIANPFVDMLLGPQIKAKVLYHDAPALVSACGLALKSFD